jgi:hypothetical protein
MEQRKANAPLTRQLFLLALCLVSVLATGNFGAGLTQSPKERKYKVRTFKNMPVAVKEVRNLQKGEDVWFRDLEIEVENISDQPIYFIDLIIEFPDIPAPPPETRADGTTPSRSTTGVWMSFGALRLGDVRNLATADDISLKPGEAHIFKVPDGFVQGFESMKKNGKVPPGATKNIEIRFAAISFGDGTGYIAGERREYPKKKE